MPTAPAAKLIPPAQWKYLICNRDGTNPAEVTNCHEKKIILPHLRLETASGRIRLDHQLADRIQSADLFLKAYRNNSLKFIGPILTCEESADADGTNVQFNAAGSFWYIQNRLLGKSFDGAGWALGSAADLRSRGTILHAILTSINGDYFTGVTNGSDTSSASLNAHFGPVTFSPAGQAITDVSAGLNAAEWHIAPTEPTNIVGQPQKQIGVFNTMDLFGITRNNVVFEYGAQVPQVTTYKRTASRDSLLTQGYILPQGFPASGAAGGDFTVQEGHDDTAIAARGRIEEVVPSDLVADDLRKTLVDEHVSVRKNTRYLLTFTLANNAIPRAFDSYFVGDRIRARAVFNGIVRFDAMFRVWGITATIDEAGNEQIELELMEPT